VKQERKAAAERQKRARYKAKTRDSDRESQEKSQHESRRDTGVSHGPPDPTRPVLELQDPPYPPARRGGRRSARNPQTDRTLPAAPDIRQPTGPACQHGDLRGTCALCRMAVAS